MPAVPEIPVSSATTAIVTTVSTPSVPADAFVLRVKITDVAKTDTGVVAVGRVLRVIQSPDPQVQGPGFEIWLGMPLNVTPPVKESECTYTLVRKHSGGNVWDFRFPNENPVGHVADCLSPGDQPPLTVRSDYLAQQTAQLFWNAVMEGRFDQAMAVVDTPFSWGIESVAGYDNVRKQLESHQLKAAFERSRGKPMEIWQVPDEELRKIFQQKFHFTNSSHIAVIVLRWGGGESLRGCARRRPVQGCWRR